MTTSKLTILPDLPAAPTPVGLIAGGGRLPVLIADALAARGNPVHGLGLFRQFDDDLPERCSTFKTVPLLRLGAWTRAMRRRGVRHAIMVGKVDKARLMHDRLKLIRNIPDARTLVAWYRHLRHDRRSHAVLAAIAEELDRGGIALMDSTSPIPGELATAGLMTAAGPTPNQQADIDFVWPLLSELLRLDIGQSLTVRDRDVLAVEAVEGTDALIERTGDLCRVPGWVLCKGSRVGHDRRSDVPTIGVRTIQKVAAAGGRCIALAADDVIMVNKSQTIAEAEKLGVSLVGVPVAHPTLAETRPLSPALARALAPASRTVQPK